MRFSESVSLLSVIGFSASLLAEPLKPFDLLLDRDEILKIPIHTEMETLLVFPNEVTFLLGKELTDGVSPGVVQFQQGKNKRVVVLNHLGTTSDDVLMQIMMGEEAHVFRLQLSDEPASIIRFKDKAKAPPKKVQPVAEKEIGKRSGKVSPERQQQLMRLANLEGFLKESIPNHYKDYESRKTSETLTESGFTTKITKVCRFTKDDALVVVGSLTNKGAGAVSLKSLKCGLLVGQSRNYRVSQINFDRMRLSVGAETTFQAILIGDGRGGPAHLSHDNMVRLRLSQ